MSENNAPFFIVGSGRSGTTLLRLVLSGHSRLHIPPETWFLLPLVARLPLTEPLSPAQVETALDIITGHFRWPDLRLDAAALGAEVRALPSPRLAELVAPIYRALLARAGKPRFGDKTPPYIGIVPQLRSLYPGARFIHLIRDGRDVAISFVDAHFRGRAYHGAHFEWTRAVRQGLAYRGTPHAAHILELRYEDLVRDLEGTVRHVCTFLGETFEPAMLDWRDRITPTVLEREKYIHRSLEKPVTSEAIGVWRRRLSWAECFLIEAALHRDLRRLGYPLRFAGPLWRPLLAGTGTLLPHLAPLLDRALPYLQRRSHLTRPIYA